MLVGAPPGPEKLQRGRQCEPATWEQLFIGDPCCPAYEGPHEEATRRMGDGREDHSPEGFLLLNTDEEKNIITILFLDSVPNINKANGSSPFTFCFMGFVFAGEKNNNGCKYL